jgi:hypothetical protein
MSAAIDKQMPSVVGMVASQTAVIGGPFITQGRARRQGVVYDDLSWVKEQMP